MTTIGYATLQIIPSLDGVSKSIERQLDGLRGIGKSVGKSIGDDVAGGVDRASAKVEKATDKQTQAVDRLDAAHRRLSKTKRGSSSTADENKHTEALQNSETQVKRVTKQHEELAKSVKKVNDEQRKTTEIITDATGSQGFGDSLKADLDKALKGDSQGALNDFGKQLGAKAGTALRGAVRDVTGMSVDAISDKVKAAADTIGVDVEGVLTKALKGDRAGALGDLGHQIGGKIGETIRSEIQNVTGLDLGDVPGRINEVRGIVSQFRARDYVGGTSNAVNMLGQLGIPGAGVGADTLDAFNTVDTGRQTVVDLLKSMGKDAPAAALAGPEGLLFAAALVAGGGLGLGASHLLGIDDLSRVRTDTSPERLGLPRVAAGPNQLPTPIIPVPGLPTDSRFPAVMPRMNTTDLPSFAPLDMPDDPKNPLGLQRIPTTVDTGGSRSGSANVEANQATVQTTTATVVASSISLGSNVMPSVPTASAPRSVFSPPSVTGPHPTVSTPTHGVVPVNPLDILAPTDKHAAGGIVDGGMTRTATIQAPVGPSGLIQWAEPSTKGEAFIPLGGGERSKSIWLETGKRLGVITAFEKGGLGDAGGLLPFSAQLRQYVMAAFPQVTDVGGYRAPDGYNEHSSGRALDVMIPNPTSAQGKALGNQIAGWALRVPGVDRIMWQRQLIYSNGRVEAVADRGSPTQNHEDHVHIFIDDQAAKSGGLGPNTSATKPSASTQGAIDPVSSDQTGSAAPLASSGGGSGAELPSSFSDAAAMPLSQLGSTITGITGETSGGHSPGDFVTAAGEGVAGQVKSALGVFGVNDSPGWLQAATQLIGGIKVGDGKGNTLFDGSNLFGSFGGAGMSAMPLAATSTTTGTPPPDDGGNVPGARAGQAPGPTYNIRTATVEDAFLQAKRFEDQRAATKVDRF